MSTRKLLSMISGVALLALAGPAHAQISEQSARELARNVVRTELQSKVAFKSNRFLGVQRDEDLEQALALAAGRDARLFIYKVSPTGYETTDNSVVYHAWSDFDVVFIVGINPADGSSYRIRGFGLAQSVAEFEKLIMTLKINVSDARQAESAADFFRILNPENREGLTPIKNILELKQAAERQCDSRAKSFESGQKAFAAWWARAKRLYASVPFQQRAVPYGNGYRVEWIVLSSPSGESCGGAPLQAVLEVSPNGHVGKVSVSPFDKR